MDSMEGDMRLCFVESRCCRCYSAPWLIPKMRTVGDISMWHMAGACTCAEFETTVANAKGQAEQARDLDLSAVALFIAASLRCLS